MITLLAFALAVCSAIAWYAASPHCMWSVLRDRPRVARSAGSVLALLSLVSWVSALGGIVGLCATLVSLMLALITQPWLAFFLTRPDTCPTAVSEKS